jgi:hypothetical protein
MVPPRDFFSVRAKASHSSPVFSDGVLRVRTIYSLRDAAALVC